MVCELEGPSPILKRLMMESMVLRKKKIVSIPQIDVPFAQYAKVITFDFANVPCDGMVFKGRSDRSGWQANSVEDKP